MELIPPASSYLGVTLMHPRSNMPYISQYVTHNGGNLVHTSNAESRIHFSLCAVEQPGVYEYKGIGLYTGNTEIAGAAQNIKIHLIKADPVTGVPTTVANPTAHELTFGSDVARWNDFAYSGDHAELDLRDSPFYWVCSQLNSTGVMAGSIGVVFATSAGLALTTRQYDCYVTRSGTALTYAGGLPISGGALNLTDLTFTDNRTIYDTDASYSLLCDALWRVGLSKIA